MATAVVTFGRMNPITVGHAKLVDKVKSVSKSERGKPLIYLSHSQDNKKNPLSYKDKLKFARSAFGPSIQKSKARTIIEVLKELDGKYDDIVIVVGSDRVKEFDTLLNKYNKKEYTFNSIKTVSAGERDPDADDVSGMSASKLRVAISVGDYDLFKKGTPKTLTPKEKKSMYDIIRKVLPIQENFFEENEEDELDLEKVSDKEIEALLKSMDADDIDKSVSDDDLEDITDDDEDDFEEEAVMSFAQRRKRALQMKRLAPRIQAKKKIAMRKMASRDKLLKRSRKAAITLLRKKLAGKKGENYANLTTGAKIQIDRMIEKKRGAVQKIAKKMFPKIMKKERERLKSLKAPKEQVEEQRVSQDKDVEDRKGTQPAKYYAGKMAKSTKQARARHFEKGAKKDDDNPSAYKPAPGDKSGKTKPSKYTLKYKQMFGEKRAKQAVAGGKVQKLVTAHGLKFKGKVYKEIDMELKSIDNNTQMVTFNIIHPKEIFGNEVKLAFKVLRRGPFMATDTSKINEEPRIPRKKGQPAGSDKHSDLYTDENPIGTIKGLKFATVEDAQNSVKIIEKSNRSHAHKIQAAIAMEQRAKVAGKKSAASVYRTYIEKMKKITQKRKISSGVQFMTPYVKPNPVLAMGEETQMKKFKDFTIEKKIDPADIDRSATAADKEKADQNIIMQLRKVVSLRGTYGKGFKGVVFDDGKISKISVSDAKKAMDAFDNARTSIDKGKVMKSLGKSVNSFKSVIKSEYHHMKNEQVEVDELFENFIVAERKLSPSELKRREEIAKDLPDDEFKKRYGDDWKSVKIATATKMAKNEENKLPPHLAKLFDKDGNFIGRTAKQKALIKKGKKPTIKTTHLKTLTMKDIFKETKGEIFLEKKIAGLVKKSEKSKIPYGILKQVYNRGMAAWRTGHRPGTTPQQWAFARVNSFITGGKTRTTADADLWAKVKR